MNDFKHPFKLYFRVAINGEQGMFRFPFPAGECYQNPHFVCSYFCIIELWRVSRMIKNLPQPQFFAFIPEQYQRKGRGKAGATGSGLVWFLILHFISHVTKNKIVFMIFLIYSQNDIIFLTAGLIKCRFYCKYLRVYFSPP